MCNASSFRGCNSRCKLGVTVLSATVLISGVDLLAGERSLSSVSAERAEAHRMLVAEVFATVDPLVTNQEATSHAVTEIGFEPTEGYSLGPVHGQVGWGAISTAGSGPAQPSVSNANPASGAQHLRCDADPDIPSGGLISAFKNLERVGPGLCVVAADVFVSQVGGTWFSLEAFDADLGFSAWSVNFLPDDRGGDGVPGDLLVISDTFGALTETEYVPGVYKQLRVESDDVQDTLKVYYDGVMIHSGEYSGGSLILISAFYDNTGGSTMDIDNLITNCAGDLAVGACCLSDGGCESDITRDACNAMDRVSWQVDTACSVSHCAGDCCLADLSCFENMTVTDCSDLDGEFRGTNVCFSVGCGGACCMSETSCEANLRQIDCDALGGVYQGRGSDCATTECCGVDPDGDGVLGCTDVCPHAGTLAEVDTDGRPLGDVHHNCAVDLQDHAIMQRNFTGPPAP